MSRVRWLLVLALGLFSAVPGRAEQRWVEVRSQNFTVLTDAGEKRGRDVLERFERLRGAFGKMLAKVKVSFPVPIQIIAFRSGNSMREHVPLYQGKPVNVAGFFQPGDDRNFIVLDLSAERGWTTIYHEYAHLLLNGNVERMPLWFDEGFAEYYSTIQIAKNEVIVGKPPQDAGDVLTSMRLAPLAQLFEVRQGSAAYNDDTDRRSLFYMQSWLTVHYFFDRNMTKELARCFELIHRHQVRAEEAIEKAFQRTSKELDADLERYLRGSSLKVWRFKRQTEIDAAVYDAQPIDDAEARTVLADLHLHSLDHGGRAIEEFEEILRARPNLAAAHRGLGYAYLSGKDYEKAGAAFRRAADLKSDDPRVHYYSALLMNREAGGQVRHSPEMRRELERAIELDPQFARAYALLTFVCMNERDVPAALAAARMAFQLSPRNEYYAMNLAQMFAASHQWDEAIAILEQLKTSADRRIEDMATEQLTQMALFKNAGSVRVEIREGGTQFYLTAEDPEPRPQQ